MASSRFIDWLTNLTAKSTTIDGSEITHIGSSGLSQKATVKDILSYGRGATTPSEDRLGDSTTFAKVFRTLDGAIYLEKGPYTGGQVQGNARGAGAFDWQAVRTAATQVASGTYAVCIGSQCDAESYAASFGQGNNAKAYGFAAGQVNYGTRWGATFGRSNAQFWDGSIVFGYSPSLNRGGAIASLTAITTDGTTSVPLFVQTATDRPTLNAKRLVAFTGLVTASTQSGTATYSKAWEIKGLIERNNAGTTSIVGTPVITEIAKDTDAGGITPSTWTIAITADDTNDALAISATGQASTTINWHSTLLISQNQGS